MAAAKDLRDLFPIAKRYAYLDHAGIAPISIPVRRAMDRCFEDAAPNYPGILGLGAAVEL